MPLFGVSVAENGRSRNTTNLSDNDHTTSPSHVPTPGTRLENIERYQCQPSSNQNNVYFVYMYTLINVSPGMCSSIYSRQEEEELTSTFHNDKGKLALT